MRNKIIGVTVGTPISPAKIGNDLKPDIKEYIDEYVSEKNFANALKGKESGAVVAMDDVSPISHKVSVKMGSKNLLSVDANGYSQYSNVSVLSDNSFALEVNGNVNAPSYFFWQGKLSSGIYTIAFDINIENNVTEGRPNEIMIWVNDEVVKIYAIQNTFPNTSCFTFNVPNTVEFSDVKLSYYANVKQGAYNNYKATLTNIQLEKGIVATEFTPYVADDTEITVKACGKNLFDIYAIAEDLVSKRPEGYAIVDFDGKRCLKCTNSRNGWYYDIGVFGAHGVRFSFYSKGYTKSVVGLRYDDDWVVYPPPTINEWGNVELYYSNRIFTKLEFYSNAEDEEAVYLDLDSFFVEESITPTEFEPYKEGETITTTIAEGAELNGIAPNMTITTDTQGVIINAEYNKDTNKVIEKLTQAIISLGGNI